MSAREVAVVRLRRAGKADIDRIMEIERSWAHLSHWSIDSYYRLIVDDVFAVAFVAETEDEQSRDRIVGFVIFNVVAGASEIYNIAVDGGYGRIGIGSMLMRAVLEECRRRNATAVSLEVRKSNVPAIEFYRRYDFRGVGERKNYYSNPVEDALVMEKTLGPPPAGAR